MEKVAKRVVGGDIDKNILRFAISHYKERQNIEVRILDAHQLPFKEESFDVVILYEAIYYLAQPAKFLAEAHRVLRKKGTVLMCTVNKDWSEFNPSPYSTKYFSAPELYQFLNNEFPDVKLYGAFAASTNSTIDKIISLIKRTAVTLHLMPRTMKGKEILKRIFFGKLSPLPNEIEEGMYEYTPPVPIPYDSPDDQYKVLYAVARI